MEDFLSSAEGDGVDDARLSNGERAGLGRLSKEDGGVTERDVSSPLLPRPLVSFSPECWDAGGVKEDLCEERLEDEEERRTCDAESARFKQGIFSRLTTGSDTLQGGKTSVN